MRRLIFWVDDAPFASIELTPMSRVEARQTFILHLVSMDSAGNEYYEIHGIRKGMA